NRGELLLMHRHDGYDLDPNYSRETLRSLFKVWNRPVSLSSKNENKEYVLSFDGRDFTENGTKGR
ncbi:MAG: SpoVR family protein, partial [Planctomycetes bacterium]|nr:SpoVR family protein [Planctomycetota bacterium]